MSEEQTNEIKMALQCICPHCGDDIIIKMESPSPIITDILKVEDIDEDLKKIINEEKENDITKKLKT